MVQNPSPVFINCGDPNGIGPEVSLKAFAQLPKEALDRIVFAGSLKVLEKITGMLGEPLALRKVKSLEPCERRAGVRVLEPEGAEGYESDFGRLSAVAGAIAGRGIQMGVRACLKGEASALVTAPSSKKALHLAGFNYAGQTEMIADLTGISKIIMILFSGSKRVGLCTTHLPLRRVAEVLDRDLLKEKISIFHKTLTLRFGITDPRIGVTALNPHASDGGIFGDEEERIIQPAIEEARGSGVRVEGPLPADSIYPRWDNYDGILAMYHDQGMIAIKMAGFGQSVNMTGGLPFPRTSPDHGTAFDIAGKLSADPGSMIEAVKAALSFSQPDNSHLDYE